MSAITARPSLHLPASPRPSHGPRPPLTPRSPNNAVLQQNPQNQSEGQNQAQRLNSNPLVAPRLHRLRPDLTFHVSASLA